MSYHSPLSGGQREVPGERKAKPREQPPEPGAWQDWVGRQRRTQIYEGLPGDPYVDLFGSGSIGSTYDTAMNHFMSQNPGALGSYVGGNTLMGMPKALQHQMRDQVATALPGQGLSPSGASPSVLSRMQGDMDRLGGRARSFAPGGDEQYGSRIRRLLSPYGR